LGPQGSNPIPSLFPTAGPLGDESEGGGGGPGWFPSGFRNCGRKPESLSHNRMPYITEPRFRNEGSRNPLEDEGGGCAAYGNMTQPQIANPVTMTKLKTSSQASFSRV
jgi:hypothetical protein